MSAVEEYRLADSETMYTTPQQLSTARKARAAIAEMKASAVEGDRIRAAMRGTITSQTSIISMAEADLAAAKDMLSEKARFEYGFQCGALEQELADLKGTTRRERLRAEQAEDEAARYEHLYGCESRLRKQGEAQLAVMRARLKTLGEDYSRAEKNREGWAQRCVDAELNLHEWQDALAVHAGFEHRTPADLRELLRWSDEALAELIDESLVAGERRMGIIAAFNSYRIEQHDLSVDERDDEVSIFDHVADIIFGESQLRAQGEPDCDNCPQPHDEYNEPDCDACDAAWAKGKP